MKHFNTSASDKVVAERIREARLARGFSALELAKALGVSRQMISKYENGESGPSAEILNRMIDTLNFPLSFFIKNDSNGVPASGPIFFRSLSKTKASTREMIKTRLLWSSQSHSFIENFVNVPKINLPDFNLNCSNDEYSFDDIEEMSIQLRQHWGLGFGPIDNLTLVMEKNGFVISFFDTEESDADACSQPIGNFHFIVINRNQSSAVRERFDLAHELGHRVLHSDVDQEMITDSNEYKKMEKEAHHFASAFLLPNSTFAKEVISTSLNHFLILKKRWKVSIAAMLYRCSDIGLLSEDQVLNIRKQMSFKKWTKKEPLDNEMKAEKPYLMRQSFELITNNEKSTKQSAAKIIEYFSWTKNDIEDAFCLPRGSLNQSHKIVQFKKQ